MLEQVYASKQNCMTSIISMHFIMYYHNYYAICVVVVNKAYSISQRV